MNLSEENKQLRLEAGNLFDCLFYISQAVTEKQEDMTKGHWAALQAALAMARDYSSAERAPLSNKEVRRRLYMERK